MPSRREFFALSGGLMISGIWCAAAHPERPAPPSLPAGNALPEPWTRKPLHADILVAGGGLAGVCAALAAARNGASVILVQDRSRLGGNSSSEIRMHVCGANNHKDTALWRETGIIEELKLTDAATNPQRSFEMWDLLLYDKITQESRITLLLDTAVTNAIVEENTLTTITATSLLLLEEYSIQAAYFIDCTGDGALAALAGARFMRGREARSLYQESLAPETADLKTMGNSLMFMAQNHNRPMPFSPPPWARHFTKEDFKHRRIRQWEYGYWWIEWGGELDTIKDNGRIRHELLRILMGVWDYIKNSGDYPDSATWALQWAGQIPGKRESRRILGEHVMVQQELEEAVLYPDRVAYGGWPMDDHPPGGMDDRDRPPCVQIQFKQPYSIPLRSLYSADHPNLFMAGRNLSASHVALTSTRVMATRVMATCATLGQATGTAAAFCKDQQCLPRDLVAEPALLVQFQQLLLHDDQALLAVRNEDPKDLARMARVTCSHHTPEGPPERVLDGWNRDIGDGVTHQWQAPMANGEAWLRLDWRHARLLRRIQLTFDSGLHRKLFLSGEDAAYLHQTHGPQPETVCDYVVEILVKKEWREVARGGGNFLRMGRHAWEPVKTSALRLRVLKTNGDPLARVFEIRCYA